MADYRHRERGFVLREDAYLRRVAASEFSESDFDEMLPAPEPAAPPEPATPPELEPAAPPDSATPPETPPEADPEIVESQIEAGHPDDSDDDGGRSRRRRRR